MESLKNRMCESFDNKAKKTSTLKKLVTSSHLRSVSHRVMMG